MRKGWSTGLTGIKVWPTITGLLFGIGHLHVTVFGLLGLVGALLLAVDGFLGVGLLRSLELLELREVLFQRLADFLADFFFLLIYTDTNSLIQLKILVRRCYFSATQNTSGYLNT